MNPASTQMSSQDHALSNSSPKLWWLNPHEVRPLILIALLPMLVALPQLLGWLHADPMLYTGAMTRGYAGGILPGYPYIDPTSGLLTQALGHRAMVDWINGEIPWWNPYSGVGLPLAAEYQPGVFFPPSLLLLLPNGIVWRHLLLQVLAGWGMYGLLRQTGLRQTAATTGGLLFAFNGTMAWFEFAAAYATAFLPWMLLGIERAQVKATLGMWGGWRLFAIAMAMNLLAGFPETAYTSGLLVLAWAMLRCVQTPPPKRLAYVVNVLLGGCLGLALSAPQILAFLEFLPQAWLGGHGNSFAHAALPLHALLPSLIVPYAYGPVFALSISGLSLDIVWGNVGGYVTIAILLAATYGFCVRRDALGWLLVVWTILAIARTFGVEPTVWLLNLVPGVSETAFYRYSQQTWELCLIVLAARGVEAVAISDNAFRASLFVTTAVLVTAAAASAAIYGALLLPHFVESPALRYSSLAAALWAICSGLALLGLLISTVRRRQMALATLLTVDSMLMCAIPTLSNPRGGAIDTIAIAFLQQNLGLQRFYTLGPIAPNYGAYFGIASINHIYLPVAQRWVDWVRLHLDSIADPINFTGSLPRSAGQPTSAQELRRNRDAYESIGVRYVVTGRGTGNPFIETLSSNTDVTGNIALQLNDGESATGSLPASVIDHALSINGVAVFEGNYNNTADGTLKATLCNGSDCASGSADLVSSPNNALFNIPLDKPLQVPAHNALHYTFEHVGGKLPVALWAYPVSGAGLAQDLVGPAGAVANHGLRLQLQLASAQDNLPKRVYADEVMDIYELPSAKPYFETLGGPCALQPAGRTQLQADCETQATLIRRELFFDGWTASVNNSDSQIAEYADLFQSVSLPAGKNDVRFRYAPPHIAWAWLAMCLALAALLVPELARLRRNTTRG